MLLPAIRLVHERNLSRDGGPFQLALDGQTAPLLPSLFPFEELVGEAQVWLYYNVEAAGSDETAVVDGKR